MAPAAQQRTLDNGVTLLAYSLPDSQTLAVTAYVRAGSGYDPVDGPGTYHLLEHMLFRGSENLDSGQVDRYAETGGGTLNATTFHQATRFNWVGPAYGWTAGMSAVSGLLHRPSIDEQVLAKEKSVINRELDYQQSLVTRQAIEASRLKAYGATPMGRPTAGIRDGISRLSRDDLLKAYDESFVGSNVVVVVAGPHDAVEMLSLAAREFSFVKPGGAAEFPSPPEQNLGRSADGKPSQATFAFPAPGLDEPRRYAAVQVVMQAIGSGGGLAERADLEVEFAFGPSPTGSIAILLFESDADDIEARCLALLQGLAANSLDTADFERSKRLAAASLKLPSKSAEGLADLAASRSLFTSKFDLTATLDLIESLTAEDIANAAMQFAPNKATAIVPPPGRPTSNARSDERLRLDSGSSPNIEPFLSPQSGQAEKNLHRLSNGIPVITSNESNDGVLTLIALVDTADLTPEEMGAVEMIVNSFDEGSQVLTFQSLRMIAAVVGGRADVSLTDDAVQFEITTAATHIGPAVTLVSELLQRPFPEHEPFASRFAPAPNVSSLGLAELRHRKADLGIGPSHIRALTEQDAVAIHRKCFRPERTTVAVFGDVDGENVVQRLNGSLGHWSAEPPLRYRLRAVSEKDEGFDGTSVLTLKGPPADSEEFAEWMAAVYAVAGGKASPFARAVRYDNGWSYIYDLQIVPRSDETWALLYWINASGTDTEEREASVRSTLQGASLDAAAVERGIRFLRGQYGLAASSGPVNRPFRQGHVDRSSRAYWAAWWTLRTGDFRSEEKFTTAIWLLNRERISEVIGNLWHGHPSKEWEGCETGSPLR